MCISLLSPSQKKKRLEQEISETTSEQLIVSLQEQLRKTFLSHVDSTGMERKQSETKTLKWKCKMACNYNRK